MCLINYFILFYSYWFISYWHQHHCIFIPLSYYIPKPQHDLMAQEPRIGHCNFTPEKDYKEIVIT